MKLLTIVGARPQLIKASAMSRAIRQYFPGQISDVLVHTGQHYDHAMSTVFFDELGLPAPAYNLQVGSGAHGEQTARMIAGIEPILVQEKPDYVLLYGDTNSTLAGAIAASKLHLPIAHVEAGLRSFNKRMPEELNRILTDHVSTFLFPPTQAGVDNLIREGFQLNASPPYSPDKPGVFNLGDIMYDNCLYFAEAGNPDLLKTYGLQPNSYVLTTLHRPANTDDPTRLNSIVQALLTLADRFATTIVLPLHPRTARQFDTLLDAELRQRLNEDKLVRLVPPASFLEMSQLERHARFIITDSGGVQKEAFFYRKPAIILRAETEWKEIVASGAARLCDADPRQILDAYEQFNKTPPTDFPALFGQGDTARRILDCLLSNQPNVTP